MKSKFQNDFFSNEMNKENKTRRFRKEFTFFDLIYFTERLSVTNKFLKLCTI